MSKNNNSYEEIIKNINQNKEDIKKKDYYNINEQNKNLQIQKDQYDNLNQTNNNNPPPKPPRAPETQQQTASQEKPKRIDTIEQNSAFSKPTSTVNTEAFPQAKITRTEENNINITKKNSIKTIKTPSQIYAEKNNLNANKNINKNNSLQHSSMSVKDRVLSLLTTIKTKIINVYDKIKDTLQRLKTKYTPYDYNKNNPDGPSFPSRKMLSDEEYKEKIKLYRTYELSDDYSDEDFQIFNGLPLKIKEDFYDESFTIENNNKITTTNTKNDAILINIHNNDQNTDEIETNNKNAIEEFSKDTLKPKKNPTNLMDMDNSIIEETFYDKNTTNLMDIHPKALDEQFKTKSNEQNLMDMSPEDLNNKLSSKPLSQFEKMHSEMNNRLEMEKRLEKPNTKLDDTKLDKHKEYYREKER